MSPDQQWISTVSMNRFYDHCYLIECAYHIISRYCCSFTNLLTHDDGSIPYYLVQKVKIAVEYGKILLNSRYRPFQHHLRSLGTYDYIDHHQYEGLCVHWNTIKAETQVVEMFFNQTSLLIYPIVSATSLPFMKAKQNEEVSALTKINAIIHSLINQNENDHQGHKNHEKTKRVISKRPKYFSEEELGLFIVNHIIEPLFDGEDEPKMCEIIPKPGNVVIEENDEYKQSYNEDEREHERFDNFQIKFDKMEIFRSNIFVNDKGKKSDENASDFYTINLTDNLIFKLEDDIVVNCGRYNSKFRFGSRIYGFETAYRKYDGKSDSINVCEKEYGDNVDVKYDSKKIKDRKSGKKNYDRGELHYGGCEFINKKFVESYQYGKNFVRIDQ